MKLSIQLGTLALVSAMSVSALAQVAVKPRPVETVRPEVIVKPSPSVKGQGLEGKFDQMKTGKVAAPAKDSGTTMKESTPAGNSCDPQTFASQLAADTGVSYANARAIVDAKMLSAGTCGEGVTAFNAQARENLLESEVCALNKGADKMAAAARDEVRAGCMAEAKNNDQGAVQTTAAAERATISALRDNCKILQ